nr:protein LURP-one-related 5-like [Solanum lycopersicum]
MFIKRSTRASILQPSYMSKIHPSYHPKILRRKRLVYNKDDDGEYNNNNRLLPPRVITSRPRVDSPSIFTVWKKSSMSFQGTDGFTVFDKQGRLVFRVDNYTRRKNRAIASRGSRSGGLVLMDAQGKPLLTLRPQMNAQLQYEWNGYRGGEDDDGSTPLFVMRKPPSSLFAMMGASMTTTSCQAQVFVGMDMKKKPNYRVEGSFRRRTCNITNSDGHIIANLSRKVANATTHTTILISDDVFSLMIQPGFEPHIFMAFVIILDRMYPNSYTPLICSECN